MEITPFRDYSDSLLPLPPISSDNTGSVSNDNRSGSDAFRAELENQLGVDVSDTTGETSAIMGPERIFDLTSSQNQSISADNGQTNYPPVGRSLAPLNSDYETGSAASDELLDTCRQIEGVLLGVLLKNMGDEFGGSSLFSKKWESGMYQDMFFFELAQSIGSTPPGLGIADMLYSDIISKAGSEIDLTA